MRRPSRNSQQRNDGLLARKGDVQPGESTLFGVGDDVRQCRRTAGNVVQVEQFITVLQVLGAAFTDMHGGARGVLDACTHQAGPDDAARGFSHVEGARRSYRPGMLPCEPLGTQELVTARGGLLRRIVPRC